MMNTIFREEINSGKVIIYMDNVLIFTETLEEHRRMVRQVLEKFKANKLFLKPEKCTFEASEVEYLGVLVSHNQVRMDPTKVAAVRDWPTPKNRREVQQFLGFANFYRRFIEGYGRVSKPLTELTGKNQWKWEKDQEDAFQELKRRVCSAPVLAMPNNNGMFRVEADSSDFATGGILSQQQLDGKWKPIAFISHSLNPTERNYEIYDKEMLAIMTSLDEWRQYLLGAKEIFEIWTDHKNLSYFRKPQKLNRRQARWTTELQEYHFTLHHKSGKQMTKADLLSRRAGHERGENDNEDVILLKPELFRALAAQVEALDADFLKRIKAGYKRRDRSVSKALSVEEPDWTEDAEHVVFWKHRIYVPKDKKLREDIIRQHHDSAIAGHPGRFKTHELITRNYWWPRIQADVRLYVEGCEICQRTKSHRSKLTAPLSPNEIPTKPWEIISVDMIGPFPESFGYDAILVFVDRFTKKMEAIPTNVELTSMGTAKLYRDHVWKHHGLPRKVISDRGPQFVSQFIINLFTLLGIKANRSTAYHPQTDGQTERVNQDIEQYICIFVNERQDDWAEWIPMAQFSYNDKIHTSTGYSPFFLNYGQHPWKGAEPRVAVKSQPAVDFVEQMKKIREDAEAALKAAAETMKRFYDRKRRPARTYRPNDQVYLEGTNINTRYPAKKLADKRWSPFKVIEKIGSSLYRLDIPKNWKAIHPVFHESLLTPFVKPSFPSQKKKPPPPPRIVNGEEEYEVEEIVDSRFGRKGLEYLVSWKGMPKEETSWEPEAHVTNAKRLVDAFHKKNPAAPRRLRVALRFVPLENYTVPPKRELFDWTQGKHDPIQSRGRDP